MNDPGDQDAPEAPDAPDPDLADLFDEAQGAQRQQFVITRDVRTRIDVYLHRRLKGVTRSRAQKLIELGAVTVNGQKPKPSTVLREGDAVEVTIPSVGVRRIKPEPIPIDILYEDRDVIVLNKQADLIVHPARGNFSGTLVNALAYHLGARDPVAVGDASDDDPEGDDPASDEPAGDDPAGDDPAGDEPDELEAGRVDGLSEVGAADYRPGIVHRLDRHTTGVMVVAKRDETHAQLAKQFEHRQTLKVYLALVHGSPDGEGGAIDEPLGKHPTVREAYAVRRDRHGKDSVTLYRVRERYEGYALVELELKTGRTHQIRVHLSFMGWPIVGDIVYGGEPVGQRELLDPPTPSASRQMMNFARTKQEGERVETEAKARDDLLLAVPALHATLLRFTQPATGEPMTFLAPLHDPFAMIVRTLRDRRIDGPVTKQGHWIDLDALAR